MPLLVLNCGLYRRDLFQWEILNISSAVAYTLNARLLIFIITASED